MGLAKHFKWIPIGKNIWGSSFFDKFDGKPIKAENCAIEEYNFARKNYQYYRVQSGGTINGYSLVVALLNTSNLKTHHWY